MSRNFVRLELEVEDPAAAEVEFKALKNYLGERMHSAPRKAKGASLAYAITHSILEDLRRAAAVKP